MFVWSSLSGEDAILSSHLHRRLKLVEEGAVSGGYVSCRQALGDDAHAPTLNLNSIE